MEKEVSNAVELAVILIGISVVISIVLVTVVFGKRIQTDGVNWLADSNRQVSEGTLASLNGVATKLPSAGAYNILKQYSNLIEKTTCHIDGCKRVSSGVGQEPCIATHLKGKVSLEVRKLKSGYYTVTIHKPDCNWYNGVCSCN